MKLQQFINETKLVSARYPLFIYFILAYAFAWLLWIPAVVFQESFPSLTMILFMLGTFAPTVAAILLTGIYEGKDQVKALLKRFLIWRVGLNWYLVVLLGPLFLVFLVSGVYILLGGVAPDMSQLPMLLPTFLLVLVFGGPLAEEAGWRGYALPRLQASHSALAASLILGILWGFWHLPLFYLAGSIQSQLPIGAYLVMTIALTVLFTWVYSNTGGSLLLVLLLHGMINTAPTTIFGQAAGDEKLVWLYVGLLALVAIVVIALAGPEHLSHKLKKQEEPVVVP
jgi:membrane protease YdiL (CAAX protease family)